jgi:galactokinase
VDSQHLIERFRQVHHCEPELETRAPGRVNLIGEHTDYNEGFVFPADIDRWVLILASRRTDSVVSAYSEDFHQSISFDLGDIRSDETAAWSNYLRGVIWKYQERGDQPVGMNLLLAGNVPMGSGLSSSAALEVAAAETCRVLSDINIDPVSLALLCQAAESDFIGVRCGIMDQFASVLGQEKTALFLDCRDLSYELVPLEMDARIVICDSRKARKLAGSAYNQRRRECQEAVEALQAPLGKITALRDVTPGQLEAHKDLLPELNYRRARHVVDENNRVLQAVKALKEKNTVSFGHLMYDSHLSLRDDYEVSCAELDLLVELASQQDGTIGARMTGAGFGGCTVNLVEADAVSDFQHAVSRQYESRFGVEPFVYVCSPSGGVSHRKLAP